MKTTPIREWRRHVETISTDREFIRKIMWLWKQKIDTVEMARRVNESEAICCRALHVGREAERG